MSNYKKFLFHTLRKGKFVKVEDDIWLSLRIPGRPATPFKKTFYLWDGVYRNTFDKWKPNITLTEKYSSTVDNNRYWSPASASDKKNIICQKRNTSITHTIFLIVQNFFCL